MTSVTNHNTPEQRDPWDPSQPRFVTTVLKVELGLWALVTLLGGVMFTPRLSGLFSGGFLAVALYLAALQAGRSIAHSQRYLQVMFWLLLQQFLIWVGMAILLAAVKVDPIGFVCGVSILPVAILLTLLWYVMQRRRTSI